MHSAMRAMMVGLMKSYAVCDWGSLLLLWNDQCAGVVREIGGSAESQWGVRGADCACQDWEQRSVGVRGGWADMITWSEDGLFVIGLRRLTGLTSYLLP